MSHSKTSPVSAPVAPPAFIPGFNEPVAFNRISGSGIPSAVAETLNTCRSMAQEIAHVPSEQRNFRNTFGRLDALYDRVGTLNAIMDLVGNVHPLEETRQAALSAIATLSRYYTELLLHEPLYRALNGFAKTRERNDGPAYEQKFIDDIIRAFERNGLALPGNQRTALKKIKDRLSELEVAFNNNIESYHEDFLFTEDELRGLPADYLDARRQPDGRIKVDLSYPSYYPVMKYAKVADVRKKLYTQFATRAPGNKEVLREILKLRNEMASLLGFDSFAAYNLDDKMASKPSAVWTFENDLREKVSWKAGQDIKKLLELKSAENGAPAKDIQPWESAYFVTRLMETEYRLDAEELKAYFELDKVLDGIFRITGLLFGVEFEEVSNSALWHPEVRMFELRRSGRVIARLYLDLFPRKHKYGHAACFGITGGSLTGQGYRWPSAALVCNFPAPTGKMPSLLTHDNVNTLFHEFGHVLHHLLTRSPLYYQSGTHVATDFVEVPSQLFENWAWEYESLKLFAVHFKSGEPLPRELFDKMIAARNADSGLHISQQLFYGILDMTFHDRYDPESGDTTNVVRKVQESVSPYPYLPGTHMETSFGHLNGYAAGYYSYLWSRVYADDMYSAFRTKGVLNGETGRRLEEQVLSMGATVPEKQLITTFLGREPSQQAFLAMNDLSQNAG